MTLLDQLHQACAPAPISYHDFIDIALYSAQGGYYTQNRERVGRSPERDFYTAESLGKVFAQLVTTAATDILSPEQAAQATFIEIAAEPGRCLLDHCPNHPFAATQVIRQGEPINVTGPAIIFANEWLDALPFHRLIFRNGCWRERGVRLNAQQQLEDCLLDELSPQVAIHAQRLPAQIEDGYELDWPLATEAAIADLLAQDWHGLLLFFDYGKTWPALLTDCPSGTARTYQQHTLGSNLLAAPGQQDITCDVCWDPLQQAMTANGLHSVTLESQESFFVHRAQRAAEAIVQASAWQLSPERQTLMELIHPAHMGQRFQVLWGLKTQ